ncbi:transmembrane protein [Perilla frutescens var. hirtella]|nr:transmembrane protein [Perilla frutescens var. frutescens]KAH6788036.1 transmembrane protein [Perilla frutescens var. hirtella]
MAEERRTGPPHAAVIAAVAVVVMVLPTLIGDQCGAVTDFIAELLSPVGLLLLPITLLLAIQFLSSDAGSFVAGMFSSGDRSSIHRATGSTAGVAVFLLLVLLLLYSRVSIFSGDDDSH